MWSTKTKQILKKLFNAVPFFKLDPKNWCLLPVSKLAQFFQVRNQSFSLQRKKKKIMNYIFHLLSATWETSCIARIKEYQRNSEHFLQRMCRDTISPLWLRTCVNIVKFFFHEQKTSKTYPLNVIYNINFLVLGVRSIITRADWKENNVLLHCILQG